MKTNILFICHGNICRSTMAEFVFRDMAEKAGRGDDFYVESAAVSSEEIRSPVHHGTKKILDRMGIDCSKKRARKITPEDYDKYDLIVAMDKSNLRLLKYIIPADPDEKVRLMMDFTDKGGEVADPWYTGDFEQTLTDILDGSRGILAKY